ncbi:MAG: hypothetical protein Q4A66_10365 [Eubacteriales bacterium]|nr:hypothetical protein [Eubacteriales bacterium]
MAKEKKKQKKTWEFSKILVTWAMLITTICIALSYILSALQRDTCSDVTQSVVITLTAIAVAYEAKSYGEKNSRNKYGVKLDEPRRVASDDDDDIEEETDDTPALG